MHFSGGNFSLNDNGMVVGASQITSPGIHHAFVWQAGAGMRDLGSLSAEGNRAYGVNNAGQIVGGPSAWADSGHPPFIYCDGKMTNLNSMIDPDSGWHLIVAATINDSGQIAGTGKNRAGQLHALLLTPNPSPQSPASRSPASQSPTRTLLN